MVQKRKYPFINGRFYIQFLHEQSQASARIIKKNDNITSKWPRAGGATMSRAQTGYMIILRFFVEILRFGSYIRKTENFHDCLEAEFSVFFLRFSILRRV